MLIDYQNAGPGNRNSTPCLWRVRSSASVAANPVGAWGGGEAEDFSWVPMDHSKSKKHEGVAVSMASNLSKKFRIVEFEHFTHQLVIVFIDELVTVCIRS